MEVVPAALSHNDRHYVLENTSCSLLVMRVQLMDFTIEGKLVNLIVLFSLSLFHLVVANLLLQFFFIYAIV